MAAATSPSRRLPSGHGGPDRGGGGRSRRARPTAVTHGALAALHALASEAINPAETDIETLRPAVETARWLGFALETAADGDDDARIDAACARLDAARAEKNYAEADRIRAALDAAGLIVQTTKAGTTAERGAGFDRTRLEDLA